MKKKPKFERTPPFGAPQTGRVNVLTGKPWDGKSRIRPGRSRDFGIVIFGQPKPAKPKEQLTP